LAWRSKAIITGCRAVSEKSVLFGFRLPGDRSYGVAAERPADVLASIPWWDPAGSLQIGDGVVETAGDPVSIDIADRAVVPVEFLDEVAMDRGVAGGSHFKFS
jgi:hypothetical protein